jgi:hypothetical protein
MPPMQSRPAPNRVAIVRGHRIHINEIPALFSEGAEPEAAPVDQRSWPLMAKFGLGRAARWRQWLHILMPAQTRDEKAVGAAAMRRQPQADARA